MPRSCPPLRPDQVGWHGRRVRTRLRLILERVFWIVNGGMSGGLGGDRREGAGVAVVGDGRCRLQTLMRLTRIGVFRRGAVGVGGVVSCATSIWDYPKLSCRILLLRLENNGYGGCVPERVRL